MYAYWIQHTVQETPNKKSNRAVLWSLTLPLTLFLQDRYGGAEVLHQQQALLAHKKGPCTGHWASGSSVLPMMQNKKSSENIQFLFFLLPNILKTGWSTPSRFRGTPFSKPLEAAVAWCQATGPALNSTKSGTTEKREREEGMEDVNTLPLTWSQYRK